MGEILLGVVVLVLAIFLLRAFVGANPKALIKGLRYAGAGLLAAGAVGLFVADRPQVGVLLASMAWGVFTGGHVWPGGWPHYRFGGGSSRSTSGQGSSVRSAWFEMTLDHESGEMSGSVLKGAHAGRPLSDLDRAQLLSLHTEVDDAESLRLLEAYLDRSLGPDWRTQSQQQEHETPPPREAAGMTRAEALKVLGLEDGATESDVRAAHRRLMLQNHPDRGGSDYLASKINEAKDVLLRE